MLALTFFASAVLLAQGVLSEGIHLLNCYSMTGTPWPHTAISLVAVRSFPSSLSPRKLIRVSRDPH